MGIRKNIQINMLLLIISMSFGISFGGTYLWGEESIAQLLPTGRSLPDIIPSDEFVYLTPSDANTPGSINTPKNVPQPKYSPDTPDTVGKIPDPNMPNTEVPDVPPIEGVSISPDGTPAAESIPPGGDIAMSPNGIPSGDKVPPEDSVLIPPNDIPAPGLSPNNNPGLYPSPIALLGSSTPDGIPPPEALDNAPSGSGYFVISPVAPGHTAVVEDTPTPETENDPVLIGGVEQAPTPTFHTNDFISNLNGERYIQVASYTEYNTASKRMQTLQGELLGAVTHKIIVYKDTNSLYYRVVVGPFQLSEIGVNLYSIRKKGYKDAFTIQ